MEASEAASAAGPSGCGGGPGPAPASVSHGATLEETAAAAPPAAPAPPDIQRLAEFIREVMADAVQQVLPAGAYGPPGRDAGGPREGDRDALGDPWGKCTLGGRVQAGHVDITATQIIAHKYIDLKFMLSSNELGVSVLDRQFLVAEDGKIAYHTPQKGVLPIASWVKAFLRYAAV